MARDLTLAAQHAERWLSYVTNRDIRTRAWPLALSWNACDFLGEDPWPKDGSVWLGLYPLAAGHRLQAVPLIVEGFPTPAAARPRVSPLRGRLRGVMDSSGGGVKRRVVGFHEDDEGHWVADLECGHTQHVRHDPPWQVRPWVITAEGRKAHLGMELECRRCADRA